MKEIEKLIVKAKEYAISKIMRYPDRLVYHDLNFAHRYVGFMSKIGTHSKLSHEDINLATAAAWLVASSYGNLITSFNKEGFVVTNLENEMVTNAKSFFEKHPTDERAKEKILTALQETDFPKVPETNVGKLLADGMTADIVTDDSKKRLKKIYEELLLHDVNLSKKKWYDIAIKISEQLTFHLPYCREEHQGKINELILGIQKDKKKLDKKTDVVLKKELQISDQELKELKKSLNSMKGKDARGIQTLFRTTSKNHYKLLQMVDKKASIMITVNSIILSLVLGGIIGKEMDPAIDTSLHHLLPIILLTLTAVGSMLFAILSITPIRSHGEFTESDVRNKSGNLIYWGNFHNMQERDYEWAFLQLMNDQEYMYVTMVKDIYYLGLSLKYKFKLIRISLILFLVGLSIAALLNVYIKMIHMH